MTERLMDYVRRGDWDSVLTALGLERSDAIKDVAEDFGERTAVLVDHLAREVSYGEAASTIGELTREKMRSACAQADRGEVQPDSVVSDNVSIARSAWSHAHYRNALHALRSRAVPDGRYYVASNNRGRWHEHECRFSNYDDAAMYLQFVESTGCYEVSRIRRIFDENQPKCS